MEPMEPMSDEEVLDLMSRWVALAEAGDPETLTLLRRFAALLEREADSSEGAAS